MQTNDSAGAAGINREEYIESVASDIKEQLPEEFDYYNISKDIEVPSPT
jgi:hypothetical protein